MGQQDVIGVCIAEAIEAFADPAALSALRQAQLEAAQLEESAGPLVVMDLVRAGRKLAAYREADYQRLQLRSDLQRRLRAGELIATARERPAGPRIEIPTSAWQHLLPEPSDGTGRHGLGGIELYDVRIAAAALTTAVRSPIAAEAPTPPPAAEPSPVYSVAVLRGWYRLRVVSWPASKQSPSEADDRAAASAHFGKAVPRSTLRAIRRELAPQAWLKPGPRSMPR